MGRPQTGHLEVISGFLVMLPLLPNEKSHHRHDPDEDEPFHLESQEEDPTYGIGFIDDGG
jgi:hypothetical protein